MFFVGHNIRASVTFPHKHLTCLADQTFVRNEVKRTYEGLCTQSMGFLVQIMTNAEKDVRLLESRVHKEGITSVVEFECLLFKRSFFMI